MSLGGKQGVAQANEDIKYLANTYITVNSESFARILFSRIALKDIFATLKNRDNDMIFIH